MFKHKLKALAGVCATAAVVAAVSASPASAAFTLTKCNGANSIEGRGATFQVDAHTRWRAVYEESICAPDIVKYPENIGSGAGRTAFQRREFDKAVFAGTDEAPSIGVAGDTSNSTVHGIEEVNAIVNGTLVEDKNARVLVIPVTSAAITVILNTPVGCEVDETIGKTTATAPRKNRAALSKQEVEEVFRGAKTNWKELAPFNAADPQCNVTIKRVVRQDSSGTTSQFKQFLFTVNSGKVSGEKTWKALAFGGENTKWPAEGSVVRPTEAGGPKVAKKVEEEDGSFGYVVLSDARPHFGEKEGEGEDYWLALRKGAPGETTNGFEDPLVGTQSNCAKAEYKPLEGGAVPTTTWGREADWSEVVGFNSAEGYSICSLSYALAWYDAKDVANPFGTITEARARAVKDYLTFVTSTSGQVTNAPENYSALPTAIRETAEAGAKMICWNMTGEKETCT